MPGTRDGNDLHLTDQPPYAAAARERERAK